MGFPKTRGPSLGALATDIIGLWRLLGSCDRNHSGLVAVVVVVGECKGGPLPWKYHMGTKRAAETNQKTEAV